MTVEDLPTENVIVNWTEVLNTTLNMITQMTGVQNQWTENDDWNMFQDELGYDREGWERQWNKMINSLTTTNMTL